MINIIGHRARHPTWKCVSFMFRIGGSFFRQLSRKYLPDKVHIATCSLPLALRIDVTSTRAQLYTNSYWDQLLLSLLLPTEGTFTSHIVKVESDVIIRSTMLQSELHFAVWVKLM